jgi:hypothetical protein
VSLYLRWDVHRARRLSRRVLRGENQDAARTRDTRTLLTIRNELKADEEATDVATGPVALRLSLEN